IRHTPFGLLRTPSRYLFLSLWGLLFAAGSGWHWLGKGSLAAKTLQVLAVSVLLLELLSWDRKFLRAESAEPHLKVNPSLAAPIGGRPFRVWTEPELGNPNKTMLYRARNVNGYEAFYLESYAESAARSEGGPAADPSRTYLRRADSPQMKRLGVAY